MGYEATPPAQAKAVIYKGNCFQVSDAWFYKYDFFLWHIPFLPFTLPSSSVSKIGGIGFLNELLRKGKTNQSHNKAANLVQAKNKSYPLHTTTDVQILGEKFSSTL